MSKLAGRKRPLDAAEKAINTNKKKIKGPDVRIAKYLLALRPLAAGYIITSVLYLQAGGPGASGQAACAGEEGARPRKVSCSYVVSLQSVVTLLSS
jgi:hypothetical protein